MTKSGRDSWEPRIAPEAKVTGAEFRASAHFLRLGTLKGCAPGAGMSHMWTSSSKDHKTAWTRVSP